MKAGKELKLGHERACKMFEVWEVYEHNGCIEPVSLIATCKDQKEASAIARNCKRPGIEVQIRGMWLSHFCNPDGSWA